MATKRRTTTTTTTAMTATTPVAAPMEQCGWNKTWTFFKYFVKFMSNCRSKERWRCRRGAPTCVCVCVGWCVSVPIVKRVCVVCLLHLRFMCLSRVEICEHTPALTYSHTQILTHAHTRMREKRQRVCVRLILLPGGWLAGWLPGAVEYICFSCFNAISLFWKYIIKYNKVLSSLCVFYENKDGCFLHFKRASYTIHAVPAQHNTLSAMCVDFHSFYFQIKNDANDGVRFESTTHFSLALFSISFLLSFVWLEQNRMHEQNGDNRSQREISFENINYRCTGGGLYISQERISICLAVMLTVRRSCISRGRLCWEVNAIPIAASEWLSIRKCFFHSLDGGLAVEWKTIDYLWNSFKLFIGVQSVSDE